MVLLGRALAATAEEPDKSVVAPLAEAATESSATFWHASLLAAMPTALQTGMATGVVIGAESAFGPRLGVAVGWAQAAEYTASWHVGHDELRIRATGSARFGAGRALMLVRVAVGATAVHELRVHNQAGRLGVSVPADQRAWAIVPAAELDLGVFVRLIGQWGLTVAGGPALRWVDAAGAAGWQTTIGAGWQR